MNLIRRYKTRIVSLGDLFQSGFKDRRLFFYNILPLLSMGGRRYVSNIISAFKPKSNFKPTKVRSEVSFIEENGYSKPLGQLTSKQVEDILNYFKALKPHDPYRPHLGKFEWSSPPSDEVNMSYYENHEILNCPHILDFINDNKILSIAESYLGCKPILDNIMAQWAYPNRSAAKGTQRFHRDLDCANNIKLFLYVTDMSNPDGAHIYVRGSHRINKLDDGYAHQDTEVEFEFGKNNIIEITGKSGTYFMTDVYGMHKGSMPVNNVRFLLAFQYNLYATPHGPISPILPRNDNYDPYINQIFMR